MMFKVGLYDVQEFHMLFIGLYDVQKGYYVVHWDYLKKLEVFCQWLVNTIRLVMTEIQF